MMIDRQTEQDYLAAIRAAYVLGATGELWYAMTQLADLYIKRGWTQTASDILAFVLLQDAVPSDVYEQADEWFDDLERSICPRVIWDATVLASAFELEDMIDYLLVDDDVDHPS